MNFLKKTFTTVDVGSSCVKVARMNKGKNDVKLKDVGYTKLAEDTIENGEIRDMPVLVSELEYLFNEMGYRPSSIVTAIPNKNLVIRNVELPGAVADDIDDAIKWEAEDYLPFPIEEAVMDYIVVGEGDDYVNVILVAAQARILHNIQELFKRLDVNLTVVNAQPLALFSLLESAEKDFATSAMIDIGAAGTRIIIGDKRGVYLYRTIDIGGNTFTEIIEEQMSADFEEAEKYKYDNGLSGALDEAAAGQEEEPGEGMDMLQYTDAGSVDELLLSTADDLAYELSRSLEFFYRNNPDLEIGKFYLTGGGSLLDGLADFIEDEVELSLQRINPLQYVNYKQRISLDEEQLSVAIGLGYSEVLKE